MCPLTFVFWAIRIVWWRFPNWKYFYVVLVSKTFKYSFYSSSSSSSLRLVIFVDVCCSSRLRQHPQSRGSCTKKPVSASFEKNIFTHIFRKMKSEKSKRCVLCTRRLLSMFVAVDVVRPLLRPSVHRLSIHSIHWTRLLSALSLSLPKIYEKFSFRLDMYKIVGWCGAGRCGLPQIRSYWTWIKNTNVCTGDVRIFYFPFGYSVGEGEFTFCGKLAKNLCLWVLAIAAKLDYYVFVRLCNI